MDDLVEEMRRMVAARMVIMGEVMSQYDGCKGLIETKFDSIEGREPSVNCIY